MKAGDVINDVGREDDGDNYGHWMLCMAGPDDTVVPTEGCEWYYDCSSDDLYQPIQGMVSLSRHSHHHCGFMFAFGCDYCCPLSDKKAETALSSTHFEEESHEPSHEFSRDVHIRIRRFRFDYLESKFCF